MANFCLLGDYFHWAIWLNYRTIPHSGILFLLLCFCFNFDKKWVGLHFRRCFQEVQGHYVARPNVAVFNVARQIVARPNVAYDGMLPAKCRRLQYRTPKLVTKT
jgi:hypothetical protein